MRRMITGKQAKLFENVVANGTATEIGGDLYVDGSITTGSGELVVIEDVEAINVEPSAGFEKVSIKKIGSVYIVNAYGTSAAALEGFATLFKISNYTSAHYCYTVIGRNGGTYGANGFITTNGSVGFIGTVAEGNAIDIRFVITAI